MKLSSLLTFVLLFPAVACAKAPNIASIEGTEPAVLVRNGLAHQAKKNEYIAPEDFLRVPAGTTVVVKLKQGGNARITGKTLLPGRRVHAAKDASALAKLVQSIQTISGEEPVDSAPGGVHVDAERKKREREEEKEADMFGAGNDELSAGLEQTETQTRSTVTPAATPQSAPMLDAPPPSPTAKARELAAKNDLKGAIAELASATDAESLLLRAGLHLQLGEDTEAKADLVRVIEIAPESAEAKKARAMIELLPK